MAADEPKTGLRSIPSAVLALFTFIAATIVVFAVGSLLQGVDKNGIAAYVLMDLAIASACFFIVRANPKSFWYVPVICNAATIIPAFVEPNFWRTELWIPNSASWVLSAIVTIFACRTGKRGASRAGWRNTQ